VRCWTVFCEQAPSCLSLRYKPGFPVSLHAS
jgi:hypothetical protein